VIDGIEFSEALRCLDPLSDMLFLSMDLLAHGRPDLAAAYERGWSSAGSDPDAGALRPLWLAYRAQVRALVDGQRSAAAEVGEEAREAARRSCGRHLLLAWRTARGGPPPLVVLVGPSGVGKSEVARAVAPLLEAVVVQSDVVRKRLAGLAPTERASGDALARLYAPDMSTRTYAACLEEAEAALAAGRAAVLDATFLRRSARAQAAALARRRGAPLAFLSVDAPEPVVRERLERRLAADTDPSDAGPVVHASQRVEAEPFGDDERPFVAEHDGSRPPDAAFAPLVDALSRTAG
jgi:predicted kinase